MCSLCCIQSPLITRFSFAEPGGVPEREEWILAGVSPKSASVQYFGETLSIIEVELSGQRRIYPGMASSPLPEVITQCELYPEEVEHLFAM